MQQRTEKNGKILLPGTDINLPRFDFNYFSQNID